VSAVRWIALPLALMAAVLTGTARASAPTSPALERAATLLGHLEREDLAHGVAGVQQGAAAPWVRPLGLARLPDTRATTATRYRIGSISKTMTAVMVMQLAEEGRLALDTPVARWFPTLPAADRVTVEMLLRHRGGYGALEQLPAFQTQWVFTPRSTDEMLATIARLPRAFEPDARAAYSNAGYLLLAFIVERAGGEPYGRALERRIVRRAGLADTVFEAAAPTARDALSFEWRDAPDGGPPGVEGRWALLPPSELSIPHGAGGVVSTAADLIGFMRALFDGRLVGAASLARMREVREGFGLGLYRVAGPGPEAWGHEGRIDAFGSMLLHAPAQGDTPATTLVWLGNGHRLSRDGVVLALRRAVFEPATPLPDYRPRPVRVRFEAEHVPRGGEPPATRLSLRGNVAPLSWFRDTPMQRDGADPSGTRWTATLTLTLRDGLPAEYKLLAGDGGWERGHNRVLPVPASAPELRVRDVFDHDAARLALRDSVLAADARFFDAFNARDADALAPLISEGLEFLHDRGGRSDKAQNLAMLRANFARLAVTERRLLAGSEVQPLGDFGAAHLGRHRFCSRPADAPPERAECEVYRFTHVWQRTPQGLQLLRVLSLDH
jgi:CubicO group peptidase (beta-lactamase class C family)/ketosteroid isomerase-like protein